MTSAPSINIAAAMEKIDRQAVLQSAYTSGSFNPFEATFATYNAAVEVGIAPTEAPLVVRAVLTGVSFDSIDPTRKPSVAAVATVGRRVAQSADGQDEQPPATKSEPSTTTITTTTTKTLRRRNPSSAAPTAAHKRRRISSSSTTASSSSSSSSSLHRAGRMSNVRRTIATHAGKRARPSIVSVAPSSSSSALACSSSFVGGRSLLSRLVNSALNSSSRHRSFVVQLLTDSR